MVFGILTLFLGFTQIKNRIYKPFDYLYKNNAVKTLQTPQQNANLEELKNKDTDKDGISDYDELNVYFTSPYLKDSDSDGILDKAEIEAGTDPNCPPDKVCDKTGIPKTPGTEGETEKSTGEKSFAPTTTLSIEEIKQILLKNGIPQEQLNQVDDATIRKVYEETVKTTGINPVNLGANSQTEIPINNSDQTNLGNQPVNLQNMSVEQMREYLLQQGMSETELKQIDDATLKELFQKAMSEAMKQ